MDDKLKVWTTVGSAGTLNSTDFAKVSLYQSIIQLGIDILPPLPVAASHPLGELGRPFPTEQAVVRYNVTPVDGLFFQQVAGLPFHYGLRIRYLGQVTARLVEVDLATGTETELVLFKSTDFPASAQFQVQTAFAQHFEGVLDFVKNGYYVEATLVAPRIVAGHAAAISLIKIVAEQPQF